jgi:hypothetical protein
MHGGPWAGPRPMLGVPSRLAESPPLGSGARAAPLFADRPFSCSISRCPLFGPSKYTYSLGFVWDGSESCHDELVEVPDRMRAPSKHAMSSSFTWNICSMHNRPKETGVLGLGNRGSKLHQFQARYRTPKISDREISDPKIRK